jgi:hypothetical protein
VSSTRTEDLTAQVNGFASTFATTQLFIAGSLVVELNGQRLRPLHDYDETSFSTFTTDLVPRLGEHLLVQYEIEETGTGFPLVVAYTSDPQF